MEEKFDLDEMRFVGGWPLKDESRPGGSYKVRADGKDLLLKFFKACDDSVGLATRREYQKNVSKFLVSMGVIKPKRMTITDRFDGRNLCLFLITAEEPQLVNDRLLVPPVVEYFGAGGLRMTGVKRGCVHVSENERTRAVSYVGWKFDLGVVSAGDWVEFVRENPKNPVELFGDDLGGSELVWSEFVRSKGSVTKKAFNFFEELDKA